MGIFARTRVAVAIGGAAVLAMDLIACSPDAFSCAQHVQCGDEGLCEQAGYCSFPDEGCDSGRRFGQHAGGGLAGECVPDDATDDGTTASTSPPPVTGGDAPGTGTGDDTLALTSDAMTTGSVADETTAAPPPTGSADAGTDTTTGAPIERVTEGLLVLYRFDEGRGTTVLDQSGVEPAIDLTLEPQGESPAWVDTGLQFTGGGIARALGSATKIREGCQATNGISVEAWITATVAEQSGPARIATLSIDTSFRNFTLGHTTDAVTMLPTFAGRLRTTTSNANGGPDFNAGLVTTDTMHVLFSRADDGTVALWVDAALVLDELRDGDFSTWDDTHQFAVGNEITLDRPWLGVVHLVAVYDRALASDEVAQNFAAGP